MYLGTHAILDLSGAAGAEVALLADLSAMEALLVRAARRAGATVLASHGHGFGDGLGVTCFAMLAESHISVHTWPEYGTAAFDIFLCCKEGMDAAVGCIRDAFGQASFTTRILVRKADGLAGCKTGGKRVSHNT